MLGLGSIPLSRGHRGASAALFPLTAGHQEILLLRDPDGTGMGANGKAQEPSWGIHVLDPRDLESWSALIYVRAGKEKWSQNSSR